MHPIARYRRAKGLTQKALAERMGVTLQAVQGWENGTMPRPARLPQLAELLGIGALQLGDELQAWRAPHTQKAA